jgi:hypothetical protein
VRFDCTAKFKKEPFAQDHYSSVAPKSKYFATAKKLFKANAGQLPKDNTRPATDCFGIAHRAGVVSRDDGLLRIRHLGQSLQTARAGGCIGNGRRRARARRESDGKQSASLDCGAQCFGSADQSRGNAQKNRPSWRPRFIKDSAAGFCLQRDRVLGTDRRIVSQLREEGSLVSKCGPLKGNPEQSE